MPDALIAEIYASRVVRDAEGREYPLHSEIHPEFAKALYRVVLGQRPRLAVEVGMGYGLSSLAILAALRDVGEGGELISIDPYQHGGWKGIGVANVRRAGHTDRHRLVEKADYLALPELLEEGLKVDFAYVDGYHTFDYVLMDFFFLDKLLRPGGIIGFNDCGFRAIRRVIRFVQTHRKYAELAVGLKPSFRAAGTDAELTTPRGAGGATHPLFSTLLWLMGRTDRYFRKLEDWEPAWNFYARF